MRGFDILSPSNCFSMADREMQHIKAGLNMIRTICAIQLNGTGHLVSSKYTRHQSGIVIRFDNLVTSQHGGHFKNRGIPY